MAGMHMCGDRVRQQCLPRPDASARDWAGTGRSGWAVWAVFCILAGLALLGIGRFVAIALESTLLGFLAADFVFLVVVSIATSGQSRSGAGRF